jgi:uncharacterized protein YidB (DUF937 family)
LKVEGLVANKAGSRGVAARAPGDTGDTLAEGVDVASSGAAADTIADGEVGLAGQCLVETQTGQGIVGAFSAVADGGSGEEVASWAVA